MLSSNYLKTIDSEADMNTKPRGRFAPSPSGRLHLGNMLSSLLAWLDVRSLGGELLFRLEDLDPERSWDEYARLMAEDLRWLGLDWDLGWPEDPSCRQGLRTERYEAALVEAEVSAEATCIARDLINEPPHGAYPRQAGAGGTGAF